MIEPKTGEKGTGFEPGGLEFESLWVRHIFQALSALPQI